MNQMDEEVKEELLALWGQMDFQFDRLIESDSVSDARAFNKALQTMYSTLKDHWL